MSGLLVGVRWRGAPFVCSAVHGPAREWHVPLMAPVARNNNSVPQVAFAQNGADDSAKVGHGSFVWGPQ